MTPSRSLPALLLAVVLGLVLSAGVAPHGMRRAEAATYCNVYPPSRIVIWRPVDDVTVRFGAGCQRSGSSRAVWSARYVDAPGTFAGVAYEGRPYDLMWDNVRFSDRIAPSLTRVRWIPVEDDRPTVQNSPLTTIKLGSVAYVSVARFGGYHEVIARGYHYSPAARVIVPSGNRVGQLQFRSPGSSVWRPVFGVQLDGSGQAVVRTWSPEPRYYRVSFAEASTVFSALSAEVRAR